jgi:hypothetical protein
MDALVGNVLIDSLNIEWNDITSGGLRDISRMIESTRLQIIYFAFANSGMFDDVDATQSFVSSIRHAKSSVQELPCSFESSSGAATLDISVQNSLARNRQLNRVPLLLSARHHQHQQQRHTRQSPSLPWFRC